ncbi:hypothetical protein [Kocuria sp.]|uniref:hypothetical protein n=1 Tax=Kocuria sp. TaxID=1871328 RepID=UPI0026DACDC9|nr:hypothetical protein [Kocuria sp.]MDO4917928.1 hypothetical protein [Kocuria sp.]
MPAAYRLRVSFRDREAGHQDEVSGEHLLEFWQAPLAPDAILRSTTSDAAYWHRAWGVRREEQ